VISEQSIFDLRGKTALVTGGSRGIGRAVAIMLAEHGMDVVVCARSEVDLRLTADELATLGVNACPIVADVSNTADIDRLVSSALSATGRIDVLVNNAVTSSSAPFDQLSDDEFRYHIDVKLMAYIRITRLVFDHMRERGGQIINIGGMTARITAPLRMTNGVVNAGVANFTKQFSGFAAPHGVTVNCVHPGYTRTERVQQIFEREAKESGSPVSQVVQQRTADIPLGRLIEPEDIASAVLFFCSPMSRMITGQCIAVDGGSGSAVVY
jgi:3-oxoacyl-[acyl-carrier protein] reductase